MLSCFTISDTIDNEPVYSLFIIFVYLHIAICDFMILCWIGCVWVFEIFFSLKFANPRVELTEKKEFLKGVRIVGAAEIKKNK